MSKPLSLWDGVMAKTHESQHDNCSSADNHAGDGPILQNAASRANARNRIELRPERKNPPVTRWQLRAGGSKMVR